MEAGGRLAYISSGLGPIPRDGRLTAPGSSFGYQSLLPGCSVYDMLVTSVGLTESFGLVSSEHLALAGAQEAVVNETSLCFHPSRAASPVSLYKADT